VGSSRSTPVDRLTRGRELAERAVPLKFRNHYGALLVLGRVDDGEPFVARALVASAPVEACDLGLVIVRFSRLQDALSMAVGGWVAVRVAQGSRLVGPTRDDYRLARRRLDELSIEWRTPNYEVVLS
jgi:hypothetical protein